MRLSGVHRVVLFFFFLTGGTIFLPAQNLNKDSLIRVIRTSKTDTTKLNAIYFLGEITSRHNLDSAIQITEQALALAEKLPGCDGNEPDKDSKSYDSTRCQVKLLQLCKANYYLGTGYSAKREFRKALGYQIKALAISEKLTKDPNRYFIYIELGYLYWNLSDYAKAIDYDTVGIRLARKAGDKRMLANLYGNLGVVYGDQGNYANALEIYGKELKIAEELNDTNLLTLLNGNFGFVYWNKGDYIKALDYDFKALRLNDRLKNMNLAALLLGNIGVIYWNQKNYPKALEFSQKALIEAEKLGDQYRIALNLNNLALTYKDMKEYDKALTYNYWSLNIRKRLNDKRGLSIAYGNLCYIYMFIGDSITRRGNKAYALRHEYALALENGYKALKLGEEIGDRYGVSVYKENIGHLLDMYGKTEEALIITKESLALADSVGGLATRKDAHQALANLYSGMGKYEEAFRHQLKYSILNDSLLSRDKTLEAERKAMDYEYDKKEIMMKADQQLKEAAAATQKQRQRIILYSVSIVLLLVLILAVFIYRSYLQKQKANQLLERKNVIIESQKGIVEKKNQSILESINYAKRIQDAILPEALFEPGEVADHFVYYRPKDIVSGDFYWRFKDGDDVFFAVVDCTGHGVPGAMMSMLGYDMLEYAVKDQQLREPAAIIRSVNEQIVNKLEKDNPGGTKDGMDLTLCRYNRKSRMLSFAGAKNELVVAVPGDIITYSVDKRSVGDQPGFDFTQHTIILEPGATLYLFTDGYTDQKGGPENKKYMNNRFRSLLQRVSSHACAEQYKMLHEEFHSWKGDVAQRDDVLIVGVKV